MGKQITEWIYEGSSFKPGQVTDRSIAELYEWDFWEFRPARKSIRNKDWIESEQRRMTSKGLKVETQRRLAEKGVEIAIFYK